MKIQHLLSLPLLAGLCLTHIARADVVSDISTATDEAVVVSTATAQATIAMKKDLAPGNYSTGIILGTWTGSVSGGRLALRINRATNPAFQGSGMLVGTSTNTRNPSSVIKIAVNMDNPTGNTLSTDNLWVIRSAGNTTATGTLTLWTSNGTQILTPGTYPAGVDIAAWAN